MATTQTAKKKAAKAPPKSRAKKTNGAGRAKTTRAKKKATAKKAAPKKAPKMETDKVSEEDVQSKVDAINKLVAASEESRTKNDWKIGQSLCWIRERVTDGTWGRVCTDMIHGVGGRVLGKSSVDKKMKLYRSFPKNEKRAVAIGVGRLDQICRLPQQNERDLVLEGVKIKGEVVQVEDMKVRDLAAYIDRYMEKAHPKKAKTPQQLFVSAMKSIAKSFQKTLDTHGKTLKTRVFEPEDVETLRASMKTIHESLKAINIKAAKAKAEAA
jgi:hypothetical protein